MKVILNDRSKYQSRSSFGGPLEGRTPTKIEAKGGKKRFLKAPIDGAFYIDFGADKRDRRTGSR